MPTGDQPSFNRGPILILEGQMHVGLAYAVLNEAAGALDCAAAFDLCVQHGLEAATSSVGEVSEVPVILVAKHCLAGERAKLGQAVKPRAAPYQGLIAAPSDPLHPEREEVLTVGAAGIERDHRSMLHGIGGLYNPKCTGVQAWAS